MGLLRAAILVGLAGLDARRLRAVVIEHGGEAAIQLATTARDLVRRRGEVVAAPDAGTPPSSQSAPCTPRTSASNVSENASPTQRQLLKLRTNWKNRCAKTWPAIVTPSSEQSVKSKAPSRPGGVLLLEHHLLARAHGGRATRACAAAACGAARRRTRPRGAAGAPPGPSSPSSTPASSATSSGTTSLVPTPANGSGRVRHRAAPSSRSAARPAFQVCPLRSLIPAAAAADAIVFPSAIFFLKSLTCASVTIGAPRAPGPARSSEP